MTGQETNAAGGRGVRSFAKACILAALMAALFACLAPAASAGTLVNGDTGQLLTGHYAQWLAESKMPVPTGQISIYPDTNMPTTCDQPVAACSAPGQIWASGPLWRAAFEHEIGHQWDFQHMAAAPLASSAPPLEPWQQAFENIWHLRTGWWEYLPHDGIADPGEWFADAYQLCAIDGPAIRPGKVWETSFNFPGYDQPHTMATTCALIRGVTANPTPWMTAS